MKLSARFKAILYPTLLALYGSGVLVWLLRHWFQRDRGFGPEPREAAAYWLKAHGIAGLLFLVLFGALAQSHVPKGWRARRRRTTGVSLLAASIVLGLTVPLLYYLSDESARAGVALVHTYLGLAALLPYAWHLSRKD